MNKKDIKEKIFKKHFINLEYKKSICDELKIKPNDFSELTKEINEEKSEIIAEMRRIRTLYNNKKKLENFEFENFKFKSFNKFYNWYLTQFEEQEKSCYYCKTEESVLTKLFEKKYTHTKRKRGKHLEIERKNSNSNIYNENNCVLACYFCNNDKSDIFSEEEYFQYLKGRKIFFDKQIKSLK